MQPRLRSSAARPGSANAGSHPVERARDGKVLRAGDLFGSSSASWKRTFALVGWLGASDDGETAPELVAPFVTMSGTGGSPATVISLDEVLSLSGEGSAGDGWG